MGNLDKNSCNKRAKQVVPLPASSASGSLTIEALERFIASDFRGPPMTLVAPNRRIAEEWAAQYPGVTILLTQRLPLTVDQDKPSKNATRKEWQNHGE